MNILRNVAAAVLAGVLVLPAGMLEGQIPEREREQPRQQQQQQQQRQVEGDLAMLYIVDVESGQMGPFEESLSQHARWRQQQGDTRSWEVYQVVAGEKLGRYYIRAPGLTFEEMDQYDEGFGQRAVEHFTSTVGPNIESVGSMVTRMHEHEMGTPADQVNLENMDLVAVSVFEFEPGEMNRFQQIVDEAQNAYGRDGRDGRGPLFTVHSSVVGTARPQVHVVTVHEGWAGLETPDRQVAQQRFAEEPPPEDGAGLGLHEYFKERFPATESFVARYRPDLSIER